MSSEARLHALVHGRVQGVGFRYFVESHARTLDLRGWVRNRGDGVVECLAEGSRDRLQRLVAELEAGPPGAQVDHVDAEWQRFSGELEGFRITG